MIFPKWKLYIKFHNFDEIFIWGIFPFFIFPTWKSKTLHNFGGFYISFNIYYFLCRHMFDGIDPKQFFMTFPRSKFYTSFYGLIAFIWDVFPTFFKHENTTQVYMTLTDCNNKFCNFFMIFPTLKLNTIIVYE